MKKQEAAPPVEAEPVANDNHLAHVAGIACAYVSRNLLPVDQLPTLIQTISDALGQKPGTLPPAKGVRHAGDPAVPVKKSVTDEFVVCLEDGKKLTMLKRYLRTHHNMSPEEYRAKWGLPHDYPMVAPAYARLRSNFAKKIGLGTVPTRRRKP